MKLSVWLEGEKRKRKLADHGVFVWLGQQIGVTSTAAARYVRGQRIPSKDQMQKIHEVTGGKVTPNDFYDLPKRRAA